jgi:hypothetical protein
VRERFRHAYGAEPLHLLVAVTTLGFAGFAFVYTAARPDRLAFLLWFGGAIVGHDLVLFWVYAAVRRGLEKLGASRGSRNLGIRAVNHFTVPAFVSALLFLVWFPLILGLGRTVYESRVGLPLEPGLYLARWLLVTAVLFSASALVYLARLYRRGRAAASRTDPPAPRLRRNGDTL